VQVGNMTELRGCLGMGNVSKTQFKKAFGSLYGKSRHVGIVRPDGAATIDVRIRRVRHNA